jgi:hypothetical protein
MNRAAVMEILSLEDGLMTFGLIREGCVLPRGELKEIDLREG